MKIGVIRGQKQPDKRNSVGVSTLLCANWLKNCVCKVIFLLSSYSVNGSYFELFDALTSMSLCDIVESKPMAVA